MPKITINNLTLNITVSGGAARTNPFAAILGLIHAAHVDSASDESEEAGAQDEGTGWDDEPETASAAPQAAQVPPVPGIVFDAITEFLRSDDRFTQRTEAAIAKHLEGRYRAEEVEAALELMAAANHLHTRTRRSDGETLYRAA